MSERIVLSVGDRRIIIENGAARFIYADDLALALREAGPLTTQRASHVEPYCGGWCADMRPSGGGVLGTNGEATSFGEFGHWYIGDEPVRPFETRQAALDAELAWLRKHRGL